MIRLFSIHKTLVIVLSFLLGSICQLPGEREQVAGGGLEYV